MRNETECEGSEATQNEEEARATSTDKDVDNLTDKLRKNTLNSYVNEWNSYFSSHSNEEELLKSLKSRAFKESLRGCFFRSICWRVFLGCLPGDMSKWSGALQESRRSYDDVRFKHCTDPHSHDRDGDLQLENPLSQNDRSQWSQFFKNEELKTLIDRDVKRTCPEMEFFRKDKNRDLLASVLFCYAREHETLSYRQGMHELLAPLVFVLHCDLQGAAHAREMGNLPDEISDILNEAHLEHDAYSMFCQVMDATNPWYAIASNKSNVEDDEDSDKDPIPSVPFQQSENSTSSPPLAITKKLKHIHKTLLASFDPELFQHLNRLEIIPQVYGLRWVRLLFGREFDLQDLLVLWDALFADSQSLDMVDYIFVAMMFNIRRQLLNGDYCICMQLLMKYPEIEDIYDLVHLAMHYRNPKEHQMPNNMRRKSSFGLSASQQSTSGNQKKKKILPNIRFENPFNTITSSIKKSFKSLPPESRRGVASSNGTANLPARELPVQFVKADAELEITSANKQPVSSLKRLRSLSGLDSVKTKKTEEEARQNEIHVLRQQLENLQEKCVFCSDKIDASIRMLQPYLMDSQSKVKEEDSSTELKDSDYGDTNVSALKNEDQLVALANLKQVRDMLRGILSFMEKKQRTTSASQNSNTSNTSQSKPLGDWLLVDKLGDQK